MSLCSADEVRWQYLDEINYDRGRPDRRGAAGLWDAFEAHAIERVLEDHSDSVIDLRASNSVCEDPMLLAGVASALWEAHVVLLLPSPDPARSALILTKRLKAAVEAKGEPLTDDLRGLNDYFLRCPSWRLR